MPSLSVLVAGLLLIAPLSALAAEGTGLDFLRECEGRGTPSGEIGKFTCAAYLNGFLDSYALVSDYLPATRRFCLPAEGLRLEQAVLVVTKWLRDNPSKLHQSARSSIYIALATAFPCTAQ